jgi:hypothetical protein
LVAGLTGVPIRRAATRAHEQGLLSLHMCRTVRSPYRPALLASVLACLLASALASPAWASRGAQVIRDCLAHDRITHRFTLQDYRDALRQLPSDVAEYSDCGAVIRRAELAAAGAGSTGGGSSPGGSGGLSGGAAGGSPLAGATPGERAAVAAAVRAGASPVLVGNRLIRPGVVRSSSIVNSLPTPVLAGIIALLVSALLGPTAWIRKLVHARRAR